MTNLEKIRNMSAEELANFVVCEISCEMCAYHEIIECGSVSCTDGILKWLNEEVEK